ncbi:uncharacterized protein LOC131161937 isoform X2 [Malania oleifera]|uniref:uncharacterized protein LOC131161937 isoform X2 n=1 Tax=Malania oleifera TaxID=397392 RepID=UPI0025AE6C30|nr:uncharacterized protein LOC131161937 isoform X2 [Malania oleifera]XP_057974005.1 uncharacterized protein LOC131161937 isoform X2 [Malania oleifera]XP_057974013.1 uncharacterized protein LOC131161937 isoform X2 [Malania oleifera]XP_057974022.1 uncharacterized protein LOC131161937 isoform X2 [Malania oleifera]
MPQPHLWQPSGFNDMSLLQQHMMFKQLQELQRQQQLQQFSDVRQQSSVNQLSTITKQATGGQLPPMINGTPIHDASQIFMNWIPRGASTSAQGVPNGLMFSQDHGQAMRSLNLSPQQLDVSLYGTPIASARGNLNQCSYLEGISCDSANSLPKANLNQAQKPVMQLSPFSNSLLGDQCIISQEQVCVPDGAFTSKQGFQGRNFFGQVPFQGLNSAVLSKNFDQGNTVQKNVSVQEFNGTQGQAGLPGLVVEKTTQIGSSQVLATLDPIEQKILFSVDDSVWDASFGKRTDVATGNVVNALERPDHLNVFPFIQGGSYSALMQSAVAEASSSDTGLQEEWSGLTFQNTELSADNQPSNYVDSEKQQQGWVDNNLQSVSLSSKPFSVANDSNMTSSFPGFQQSGPHFSSELGEGLHQDSSHESSQQSPKNAKWLDSNPQKNSPVDKSQQVQPLVHLENAWDGHVFEHSENNAHQQSILSYNKGGLPCSNPKGRPLDSLTPCGNTMLNTCGNERTMDNCWMSNISGSVHKEKDIDSGLGKTNGNCGAGLFPHSIGGLELGQPGLDTTLTNREISEVNNFVDLSNSNMNKDNQESSERIPDNHQLDYKKHVDVYEKCEGPEGMGKGQHQLSNDSQIFDHSYKGADEIFERKHYCYPKENSSNDSYNSNSSQHTVTGREVRNNARLNASDSQPLTRGSQKSSSQVVQKVSTAPRFFFHPVGNLGVNVEPADRKHVGYPQVLCPQDSHGIIQEQGYFGQFKSSGTVYDSSMGSEKGHLHDFQVNLKVSEENPRGNLGSNASAALDRPVGFYGSGVTAQTSQNMLKLLHKVDQSGEGSTVAKFQSQMPREHSPNASVAQLNNHSYASQTSGSRLAPQSQQLLNSDHFFSSQGSPQMEMSRIAVTSGAPYSRNQLHRQLISNTSLAGQSSRQTLPGTVSRLPPPNLDRSQDTALPICSHPFGEQFPVLEAVPITQPIISSMPQQSGFSVRPPNEWTNLPTQQQVSAAEFHKFPSALIPSSGPSYTGLEAPSWAPHELSDQNVQNSGNGSLGFGVYSMNSKVCVSGEEQTGKESSQEQTLSETLDPTAQISHFVQGKECMTKHLTVADAAAPSSLANHLHPQDFDGVEHGDKQDLGVSGRDFTAFGRSLRPSLDSHQNYSLLHQVQAMNNVDSEPSGRASKTCNGSNSDLDFQLATVMAGQQSLYQHVTRVGNPTDNELNAASHLNSFPFKMQSLMTQARADQTAKTSSGSSLQGLPSQETVKFGQNDSQSHSSYAQLTSRQMENSHISLQMAPSWFKQYGTFKNGEMLPMYDARTARSAAEQISFGKHLENLQLHRSMEQVNAADVYHLGHVWPHKAANMVECEHMPNYILPSDVTNQSLAVMRPKKRKTGASVFLPWHKEVTNGSQAIQNISMAEQDWAQVTNCLVEKMDNGPNMIEDGLPTVRPKRRLKMTTQLMQQLLRPPPAAILSADATSDHDCVAYYVAKLALGDACGLNCCIKSDSSSTMMTEKVKASERIDGQYFSKVVEGFAERAKKLENDLSRLDKTVSILDIRLECQELEKCSIINRFAKFHSRVLTDASQTSSPSGTTMTGTKTFPQRYVIAHPLPRNLPEQMHCVSL